MINADQNEIAKFDHFAEDWWDPNGPMKPLHLLNPVRLDYIKNQADIKNKRILDVGCGAGLLSEAMAREGADVTGIDLSDAALSAAKAHAEEDTISVDYQNTPVETLAEQSPRTFDIVTCMEMLEHVPDPEQVIRACAQLTKPGGLVFFSTLNRNLKSYAFSILAAEYLLKLLPKGTHDYAQFIRPSELARWARNASLDLKDLSGMRYHVLKQSFNLSRDLSVNYLACYQTRDESHA